MGVHLLNICVDIPNTTTPININKDLSFNDQESIVEFFFEKVLGYEDTFEEYDDNDTEDNKENTDFNIKLVTTDGSLCAIKYILLKTAKQQFPKHTPLVINKSKQLETPPPRA
ncbi:hypothetical protein [Wenyingzhuangia fucanilytica]|uniref:hypothetical protein n=1 Tax=Wenyingzhuangia fucanilytica TaxID=1790137 RepID=UPI00083B01AE|nr:hypothetical protein [Wenyingzhuangia fucanilytica]